MGLYGILLKSRIVCILIPMILLSGCSLWEYLSTPDNAVEEIAEAALDHYTGIDLDFTPGTPEKH